MFIFQNNVFVQILFYPANALPHPFLENENFIMRSILYEEHVWKNWWTCDKIRVKENREKIKSFVETITFCIRQNIALWEH